jgi:hypothetical protein
MSQGTPRTTIIKINGNIKRKILRQKGLEVGLK